jgi:signal transduction histidine kinase
VTPQPSWHVSPPPAANGRDGRDEPFGAAAERVSVLLVDDSPSNLLALEAVLETLDERLVRASSGRQALDLCARERFAVVLLDVNMPGLDGLSTARALRERERAEGAVPTPVIFLTAGDATDRALVSAAYALGAVDFLGKPFDPDALRAKVAVFAELAHARVDAVRQVEWLAAERAAALRAEIGRAAAVAAELRLAAVLDAQPDAVSAFDVEWRWTYMNPHAVSLLESIGLSAGAVIGRELWDTVPILGTGGFRDAAERAVRERCVTEHEDYFASLDRWLDSRIVPTADGAVVIVRDVTDLHRLLDDERSARTSAQAMQREAEHANRAKTEFLSTMSHELRTPLNAIQGYVDLLDLGIRGDINDAQRDDLARIRRSTQYLTGLINDLLNFTRLEAGHVEFRSERFAIGTLLDDVDALVAPLVAGKSLRYEHRECMHATGSRGGEPLLVLGDPEKLKQILLNVLTNGIKFTEPGGRIALSCSATATHVSVSIADNGRGIPPEQLGEIWEPFVQVDRHLTHASQQGIGLGLAISRDLARRMGGDLGAVSEVGVGSTFTITMPRG